MDHPLAKKTGEKPCLSGRRARVLLAPLDWGLGHATRCIPIIRELENQNCEVILAGEGPQMNLLQQEFPSLNILSLKGYRIRYGRSGSGLVRSIFFQIPGILRSIRKEHEWLASIVDQYQVDAVISDNRFGLYHKKIPCVFITHQLMIKTSFGKPVERILQKKNYRFINRFSICWVPDEAGETNLAGELSHPVNKPAIPVEYIGLLSRFQKKDIEEKQGHLLIILSGPEPQRSILENKIIKEIAHYNGTATIVRGLPGSASIIPSSNMIRFYNHLPGDELNEEMMKAEFVIARSGYSTVTDISRLQKKSILVPTPGQTEQEYLAASLLKKEMAFCMGQREFSLSDALSKAESFQYKIPTFNNHMQLHQSIEKFISILK